MAIKMAEQVSTEQDEEFFDHMPRSGIARSYDRSTLSF